MWSFGKRETKEADETKELNEAKDEKNNEFVSEFEKRYKVDKNGNYVYHDTPKDPTQKQEVEKKSDDEDDNMEANSDKAKEIEPERKNKGKDDDLER